MEPFPLARQTSLQLALVYPSRSQLARKVTAFRNLLFEWKQKFQVD
jgi:hypothetical protein